MTPSLPDVLGRRFVFVTGKGGVGKTTVAAALGRAAAAAGRRVVVCEIAGRRQLPALLGMPAAGDGADGGGHREREAGDGLWTLSIDPDAALREWVVRQLHSDAVASLLTRSNLYQYFTAAAPGAREMATATKLWELGLRERWRKGAEPYDLVIADLPASGHGLGLLRTARTFADLARVGPVASQARAVREIIEDPAASALVAVSQAGELPVTETLELEERAGAQLRRGLDAIVVNAVLAARWSGEELSRLDAVDGALPRAARRAAHAEAGRSRAQQGQLRRLRRGAKAHVVTLPFLAAPRVGPAQVDALARRLERELAATA